MAASIVMFEAARFVMLRLFWPDRYFKYPLHLLLCLLLAACVTGILGSLRASRTLGVSMVLAAAVLGVWLLHGLQLKDYRDDRQLCQAVKELPPDALFAGHPHLLDNVMTFGQKPVLASYEFCHVWSLGYWEKLRPRLDDMLTAYYGDDPAAIRLLASKYGVRYLAVDRRHFRPEFIKGKPLFAPYNDFIRRAAGHGRPFAALNSDEFPRRWVNENQCIVEITEPSPSAGG